MLRLLHQPPGTPGSARRLFRGRPVLAWTLERLGQARQVASRAVLCWDDQVVEARRVCAASGATVESVGVRISLPSLEAIGASLKWADGWRGGLLGAF